MNEVIKCHEEIFVIEIHARSLNKSAPQWCAFGECESTTDKDKAGEMLKVWRARFPKNKFRVATFRRVTREEPQQFAASGEFVYQAEAVAARASSTTMARRIANALNLYPTDRRGQ